MNETTLVVYVGGLKSGYVVDPMTRAVFEFVQGVAFEVPADLAKTLGPDFEPAEKES